MKFIIMFVAAFALTAGVVAFARVSLGEAPEAETATANRPEESVKPKPDEHSGGHSEHNHSEPAETNKPEEPDEKPADPEVVDIWADDVKIDLENANDPVNGQAVTDENRLTLVFHGFKVHLNAEKSVKRFKRRPIQYLVPIELEMLFDRSVKQVNPADFIDPPIIPETCPMMGSEIEPEAGVFMFHRGYKIYFCCWNGCADDFLAEPAYAAYGLMEADGKLVALGSKPQDLWANNVRVNLANDTDPVNGGPIVEESKLSLVYDGFKIFFNAEKSVKRFKRRPIQYLVPLKLEMLTDLSVKQVKPSDFIDPPIIPETCPMMGSEIDPEGEVFMFHRGYKIYFCCWNGCADDFLAAPEYVAYGLKEQDGKLVPIE